MRYYDPGMGRFLNQDPMGFSQGPNFYTYTNNNPTIYTDSFGLWTPSNHYDLTYNAAIALVDLEIAGDIFNATDAMAMVTAGVDDEYDDYWPLEPGNNPWHYYKTTEEDSSKIIKNEFGAAVRAVTKNEVILHLGQGLHPLQDKWAHKALGILPPDSYDDILDHIGDFKALNQSYYFKAQEESNAYIQIFDIARKTPIWSSGVISTLDVLTSW
jgi:hypothetical protein